MPRLLKKTPLWLKSPGRKCIDRSEEFFKASSPEVMRAKNVCNGNDGFLIRNDEGEVVASIPGYTCPYRDTCLRYAINEGEIYGVWGGTSERDRRKILRARNRLHDSHIYSLEDVKFPGTIRVKSQTVVLVKRRAIAG